MASVVAQTSAFGAGSPLALGAASADSLESFPGAGKRSLGQSHSDGDDDQERPGHVKKRRKQSKPVRIAANDTDDKAAPAPTGHRKYLDFAETSEHFQTEGLAATGSPAESDAHRENTREGDRTYDSTLPLNLSGVKSPFAVNPSNTGDGLSSSSKHVPPGSASQYHSREDAKTPVTQDTSYLSHSPSLLLPLLKQTQMQSQLSQITSQMRIFNPEAFCDLCNKEFCNKYFLKTHKANKHGIFTESQGPSLLDPLPSMGFTNYFSSNSDAFENQPVFHTTKSLLNQPSYLNVRSGTGGSKKAQPQQSQPQGSVPAAKSNSNGNTRALCNICQREFCNKYFVRRHKLKIHGIDETASKDGSNEAQENNSVNNNNIQVKTEMPSGELDFFSGYGKHLNLSFNIDAKDECQNVVTTEEILKEKYSKDQEGERPEVPSYGFSTTSENSFFQLPQHEENNKENNVSPVKLKKFGVVNADAFCDICCKEYCNKYFLRTHKLKSHGIIPVEEKKDETMSQNGSTGSIPWYQLQSTPLNLIVGETTTNRPEIDNKSTYDMDPEESVCEECGRYFQSKFLLKIHQAYTHVKKNVTFDSISLTNSQNNKPLYDESKSSENGEENPRDPSRTASYSPIDKSEIIAKEVDEVDPKPITTIPEDVQKMQTLLLRLKKILTFSDNTICDVCEKDVGIYFSMEDHILQEHYELLQEIASMNEEDNSSNQPLIPKHFFLECTHCQMNFLVQSALDKHIRDQHVSADVINSDSLNKSVDSNSPSKMLLLPFTSQSSEEKQCLQTPASSFCEICKKELCNKYFMKTHMQRMHGISIENGAQIGGVVCDICNKELCSKYFLRVHKQNSHGIIDELLLPQLGIDFFRNQSPNTDSALKPTDQSDLSNRYFTHFNEVCPICNRRFRSVKWLKAHLWNDHGEEGKAKFKDVFLTTSLESKPQQFDDNQRGTKKFNAHPLMFNTSDQPVSALNSSDGLQNGKDVLERQDLTEKNLQNSTMFSMLMNGKDSESKHYQCSYCPFTTTILALLFIHERSHSNARQYQPEQDSGQHLRCPVCFSTLDTKENFEKHLNLHNNAWHQPYVTSESVQDQPGEPLKPPGSKIEFLSNRELDFRSNQEIDVVSPTANEERMQAAGGERPAKTSECSVRCTKCGFGTSNVQQYLEHMSREHPDSAQLQTDRDLPAYLHQMERALSTLACNSGIPAVFAVPRRRDTVTMQPFVLEDSDSTTTGDTNDPIDSKPGKTFLSSLVFLPVKEKLKKTVTASFKLTPT